MLVYLLAIVLKNITCILIPLSFYRHLFFLPDSVMPGQSNSM